MSDPDPLFPRAVIEEKVVTQKGVDEVWEAPAPTTSFHVEPETPRAWPWDSSDAMAAISIIAALSICALVLLAVLGAFL